MPWLILLQAQPRLVALYKYLSGSGNESWVKTRRTIEEPTSDFRVMDNKKHGMKISSIKE
jgi:hypothetical protein